MGGADPDQARFFAPGNHLNRKSERGLEGREDMPGIFCLTQGTGGNGAHRIRMKCAQALAKALQGLDAPALRKRCQVALMVKSGGEPDAVFEDIHRDDLNPGW